MKFVIIVIGNVIKLARRIAQIVIDLNHNAVYIIAKLAVMYTQIVHVLDKYLNIAQ